MRQSFLSVGVVLLFLGPGSRAPAGPQSAAPVRTSVPLANLLERAEIDSPLQRVPAASRLEDLGEVQTEVLLAEDFDLGQPPEGWRLTESTGLEADGEGHALVLRRAAQRSPLGWAVDAAPGTHYRFTRRSRTADAPSVDFCVVEALRLADPGIRGPFDRHYMAGRGLALKVHWPETVLADGEWHQGSVTFFSTPETKALAVVLRPTVSRRDSSQARDEIWFDDLRLEKVLPSLAQEVSLLKGRDLTEDADPDLGMRKHGQFAPIGAAGDSRGEVDDNYSYRSALYAPPDTDLTFPLSVPAQARLRFATLLSRESSAGAEASFQLLIQTTGEWQAVWDVTRQAGGEHWRWQDHRFDLGPWAGQDIQLRLRTRSLAGRAHALWGHPTLELPFTGDGPDNVILIAVDTLRADRLSSYGYPRELTPHLDALAADGVRFDQAATVCNWTCPSFASLFTGVYPSRHGVLSYGPATPVPAGFHTLAEHFRDAGFATHSISYKPPLYDGGFEQGFDVSFNVPREIVQGEENLAEALEWLEGAKGRRNFLFLHFNDPHQPFTQPEPFDRMFGEEPEAHGLTLPFSLYQTRQPRDETGRDVIRDLYDGEVAYVDDRIGAFLQALREQGMYENSVIAFVSDHGEQLWEHGTFGHGPTFGAGGDRLLFDEVVRVPMLVKPALGDFVRNTVVDAQVQNFDLMPTLLELAGVEVSGPLDARSLVPFLTPGTTAVDEDRLAVTETSGTALAVRSPRWKYVRDTGGRRGPEEALYDLAADPEERQDVLAKHPDVAERLRTHAWEYPLRHRPGRYLVVVDPANAAPEGLRVTGPKVLVALEGPAPQPTGPGAMELAMPSEAPRLWLYRIEGDAAVYCNDRAVGEADRFEPGQLARLLAESRPGVFLFSGPPRVAREPRALQSMDARQLEILRRLGYIDDDG